MARPRRTARERLQVHAQPIQPTAVYRRKEAAALLRLSEEALSAEVRSGRLRVRQHGQCWLFLGSWLVDWATKATPTT